LIFLGRDQEDSLVGSNGGDHGAHQTPGAEGVAGDLDAEVVGETGAGKRKGAHSDHDHQGEHDQALEVGVLGVVPSLEAGYVGEEQGEQGSGEGCEG